jgi:TPR repeat protein
MASSGAAMQCHPCRPSIWRALLAAALSAVALAAGAQRPDAQQPGPSLDRSRLAEDRPAATAVPDPTLERDLRRLRADAAAMPGAARRAAATSRAQQAEANWVLGLLALHGLAGPIDAAEARLRFERAQQLGHRLAAAGLAWCAIDGCQRVAEPIAARRWLAPLRSVNPGRALYLEWLIERRLSPLQLAPTDLRGQSSPALPRRDLLTRAATAGDAQAQLELGFDSVAAGRPAEALAYFLAAAPDSPAAAANANLVAERMHGQPARPGDATARQWFLQGRRYHQGDGVPANYAEAIRLYQLAADKGNIPARRMLELIFSRPARDGGVDIAWMQQLAQVDTSPPGAVAILTPLPIASLRRDPTPLYDLVPRRWRSGG